MSKTLRIGIIGSGGIAGAHARSYQSLEGVEIVAVADIAPGRAQQFIQQWGLEQAQAYDDHRQLLELDLDGVSICTPNASHYATTIDSLQAGAHVMLEKPMSVTLDEAAEMVQTAKQTGRMLNIGFQPRYDPNMATIRQLVQSCQLGKVYYVETGGGRRRGMPGGTFVRKSLAGAGAIADIGCYSLDMALSALGNPKPITVSAYSSNHFGTNPKYHPQADAFEVEDFGSALIRFENDLTLHFKISWAMHMDSLGATMFLGTDAGLKVTPAGTGPWGGVFDGSVGSITMYHDIQGHHTESPIPIITHNKDLFLEKVRDFVEAVREGRQAPIPGQEILYNQAIIDGFLRSAALKREVEITVPAIL
ncbi:Gfo/Idh/MocA family oxidoreductase [Paenibacillus sp. UMB4589-SE434]|uniref:Gfo/Idh/MocA family protein n=1 Tax=Paenibacillus sp. UMB4589-SE434 TaxID=3046314 RepID=UPI00254EF06F|nr:Gfo/Idh/MocA family oxidoreductase [Paenibacillus sp. UMB4589-SE434]MDK8183292.1 Gfo/Idh/MocA family oxidoreductase [Paenibacillus sp. UMB4589-SE434]